jgi:hypothetical protein
MRTKLLVTLFFSLALGGVYAQGLKPCATITTDAVRQKNLSVDRSERIGFQHRGSTYYVPVKIHLVGTDDGLGHFRKEQVFQLMCEVNEQFAPLNVRFYIYDDINYINNSNYNNHDFSGGYNMMIEHNFPAVVNTYIVSNPAGACGYAYYPNTGPNGGGIVLAQSCSGTGNSTYAHEFGHYFSLPHTFDEWDFNPEYVNGSNCAFAGDYFCDTPADFIDYRWSCPYSGNFTDPNGDVYNPDGTNFMSYSNEPCPSKFSNEQKSAMLFSLNYDYNGDLVNHPNPSLLQINDVQELVFPENNAVGLDPLQVILRWNSIEGAEQYHLIFHRRNAASVQRVDVFLTDTFYVLNNLLNEYNYEWRVKPFHSNALCSPYSQKFYFKTGTVGVETLSDLTEKFEVFPNPVAGGQPITIRAHDILKATQVEVLNLNGKIFSSKIIPDAFTEANIELPFLSAGVYLIKITSGNFPIYKKLIVE